MTHAMAAECLFFRLNHELRDKIYDLVFATEHRSVTIQFATAHSTVLLKNKRSSTELQLQCLAA
jgi:hypothetical protein